MAGESVSDWAGLLPDRISIRALAEHNHKHEKLNLQATIAFCQKYAFDLGTRSIGDGKRINEGLIFRVDTVVMPTARRILTDDGNQRTINFTHTGKESISLDVERSTIRLSEFERLWIAAGKRRLSWFAAEGTAKTTNSCQITLEWKSRAREIGVAWLRAERKAGRNPGVIDVAKYVEGELSRLDIRGSRGKWLDWETIKREALTGITGRKRNGAKHQK